MATAKRTLTLVVQSGPLRGQSYPVPPSPSVLVLGKHPSSDVVFHPPEAPHAVVGRAHALLRNRPEGASIFCIHTNGVFVNEQLLLGYCEESPVQEGDSIRLGQDGPVLSLVGNVVYVGPDPTPIPEPAPLVPPSEPVQELFGKFRSQILGLNDQLDQADNAGGSLQSSDMRDKIEELVSISRELRMALGLR